ncbi:MAG: amidohydrolase family protein [Acidimicrobiia bacterium]
MRLLFHGGSVVDPVTGPAVADVAVEDGRIVDVGSGLDGDEAVDCTGKHLLPGLFDCHVHVAVTHIDIWRRAHTPFSYNFYLAIENLQATLAAGITSVRDAGGADLGMKEAVDHGLIAGPRMQIAINMLSQTGGHGDGWLPSESRIHFVPPYPGHPAAIVDGPDEMRRKVRELIRAGADVIKVATSGGVLSPRDEPSEAHFRPEELAVLVEEAAAAGRWVMAHAQAADGVKNAIRAGIRSIEHGIYLDDEAISLMLEHGTYLVPTLVAPTGVLRAVEAGASIPPASVLKAEQVREDHRASFARAVDAGVRIAMGTDSAVTPHGENLAELELMVEGGMTERATLEATTIEAARLLGVEDELGSIEPGKIADLVVVDGDPYDFASLRERIEQVWKDGVRAV